MYVCMSLCYDQILVDICPLNNLTFSFSWWSTDTVKEPRNLLNLNRL